MKKNGVKNKIGLFFLILAAFLAFSVAIFREKIFQENFQKKGRRLLIAQSAFEVEMAQNDFTRQKGLSGRDFLCRECGMLFVFPHLQKTSFWMKDMRVNLDILWIADGKVVHIEREIDHKSLKIFSPDILADQVLEINSGVSSELGIQIGDRVVLE
jgi:uncharacterized membrane protein (UPF0127 family)